MEGLRQQLEVDLKDAMRARDAERLSVLRMLKSSIEYAAIEKGGAFADADVLTAIRKELKKREEAAAGFEQGGRKEAADKERAEAKILSAYLPPSLSDARVEALVREIIAETGATGKAQMGAVMKAAQAKAGGAVDGKALSQVVQRLLAQ